MRACCCSAAGESGRRVKTPFVVFLSTPEIFSDDAFKPRSTGRGRIEIKMTVMIVKRNGGGIIVVAHETDKGELGEKDENNEPSQQLAPVKF